ncbi:MAG: mycothiol conjugate amidase Mca [Acidimicrobiales bacterium]
MRRCLLAVHAHPDDESSKGAGTVARYSADGVHTVLVCCTGGEEGSILNPAMERPEVVERLHQVRLAELAEAVRIIGYDELVMLGYRDSGMPETEANARPDNFANAPLDEAVGRLVAILRRTRPQVVMTYGDDQKGYPHPDHLRVHEVTMAAIDAAADPGRHPEAGEPWQVAKVYWSVWSRARMVGMHEKFLELGLESPYTPEWLERPSQEERITATVPIHGFEDVRRDALLAHATQVDPTSPFWFGLPWDVARTVHPYDDWVLARSVVATEQPESDLFAGL